MNLDILDSSRRENVIICQNTKQRIKICKSVTQKTISRNDITYIILLEFTCCCDKHQDRDQLVEERTYWVTGYLPGEPRQELGARTHAVSIEGHCLVVCSL